MCREWRSWSGIWIINSKKEMRTPIHYAPYGELIANQTPYLYDERYKFTGKERDEETGYDFFGARYYTSIFSHWLSVDPLADKYPNISPYAYCSWNPVKFVDPDGEKVYFAKGVSDSFKNDFKIAVNYMNQYGISSMLSRLEASPNVYYIAEGVGVGISEFNANSNTITWYSRVGIITDNSYEMAPVEVLNHEIDHALRHDTDPSGQKNDKNTEDPDYGNMEERRVVTGSEQETARKLGKLEQGKVTRNNHNGSPNETKSPITTEDKWSFTPSEH